MLNSLKNLITHFIAELRKVCFIQCNKTMYPVTQMTSEKLNDIFNRSCLSESVFFFPIYHVSEQNLI